ncbi:MAG: hypothetical protein KJ043_15595, partial [Anaerolineae bacterium]|nr:hypothetical protein [Anaerolineae bacterium]
GAPALGYGTGPSEFIDNLIVATSVLGRAECDWTGSYLECSYFALIDGQPQPVEDLYIPVGDYYVVEEAPVEGWVNGYGTGTFTYDQCLVGNIRIGRPPNPNFDVVGYCNHRLVNVVPDTESVMVVEIDKFWLVGTPYGGLDAPAEGGGYYGPNYDILGLIVATSDYGTLTCDWLAVVDGGYLSCNMQFTNRPPWYNEFDELPVPAGGSYTVTENVPDGWTLLSGTGTFTINNCTDSYVYTEYYEVDGEEVMVNITECWHNVVNQTADIDTDDFYGVQIEKIWAEEIETALQNRGLNSPALGGGNGPDGYYYPLIRAFSNYGEVWCDWYAGYGLECYYNSYPTAPFPAYDYLLVGRGESFTVTEAPIDGYINVRGLGTFDESSCNFVGEVPAGRGYEGGYVELPICRHEVENIAFETEDYYRVVVDKYWDYAPDSGLNAPAQGGGYDPYYNIPNFITLESSIATGTCSWVVSYGDGELICQYSPKDGQSTPDNSGLWVPSGEGYTVTENTPEGWETTSGVGSFESCPNYFDGTTCYHRVYNTASQLPAYHVYIAKFWENFLCDEYESEFEGGCSLGEASANSGLNAPLAGGFYSPGPDVFIRNIITVTSDLGSLSCDWVPRYYDAYYDVTVGELECRITSIAEGYPPYYGGLWVPAGGSYTVTENLPEGYYTVYGTGT